MGAWNYGVFDDDTAYDALTDLKNSLDIIADMERYFDEVIQAEYIGYDEAHYALVSAAVIDSVINTHGAGGRWSSSPTALISSAPSS